MTGKLSAHVVFIKNKWDQVFDLLFNTQGMDPGVWYGME